MVSTFLRVTLVVALLLYVGLIVRLGSFSGDAEAEPPQPPVCLLSGAAPLVVGMPLLEPEAAGASTEGTKPVLVERLVATQRAVSLL